MRLRVAVPTAEIWDICRPFLVPGIPLPGGIPAAVASIAPPESSDSQSLTFLGARLPLRVRDGLRAALILADPGVWEAQPGVLQGKPGVWEALPGSVGPAGIPLVAVNSIHAAMAALLHAWRDNILRPQPFPSGPGNQVSPSARVEGCLEGDVSVGAGAYVGKGCFIGSGTRIEPNATLLDHCLIGRNCRIQSGAVIGCAGFGFFQAASGLAEMPHLGGVEIGDDCWIGANTVVAAGVLAPTVLGRGCKLDSHVQIAHNVRLGDHCLLASQSGMAGSTVAGHHLRLGGASSVDGHLRLGDHVSVAACSGVTKDWPDHAVVAGFPARPIGEWRKRQILLKKMGEPGHDRPPR